MQSRAVLASALILLSLAPSAAAGHIDTSEFRKGCGFTEDQWEEGVYDCAGSIPSIQEPDFRNASYADGWLNAEESVIGVTANGTAKAYPLPILNWHEVANDEIGGTPIAVTYCPLCGSAIVFERTVDERVLDFHVSGYLFRQDLVMVDEQTHSLWPQIEGSAARGPLHGTDLGLYPSTTIAWEDWKAKHPDTLVLERPRCGDNSTDNRRGCRGDFQRNYENYPYGSYRSDRSVGITGQARGDVQGLHPKANVVGVVLDGTAKAYPLSLLSGRKVLDDEVAGTPVVVTWVDGDAAVYERPGNRSFHLGETNGTIVDERGNRYDAATGASHGAVPDLRRIETVDLFWFAWLDHHPKTQLYTANGTITIEEHDPPRSTPLPSSLLILGALAGTALVGRVTRNSGRS